MNVAVIPARGGSKRIPRKNIKNFNGKPMLAHAIEIAKRSELFEDVVVSTDDEEIAQISRLYGAKTPFVRPLELADDVTPTVPVVAHAIKYCRALGWSFDYVCCIYPCVPLMQATDLKSGLAALKESGARFSFPIAEFPSNILRALKRGPNGLIEPVTPSYQIQRTQDLETAYFDAGQYYWGKAEQWMNKDVALHSGSIGLVIPQWRAVDIDTAEDWIRAELIYRMLLANSSTL